MSKLEDALQRKVEILLGEKDELQGSLQQVEAQLDLCHSLLAGEVDCLLGEEPKKKRGRPRKVVAGGNIKPPTKKAGRPRKKAEDPEVEAALQEEEDARSEEASVGLPDGSMGTTPEAQARAIRRFQPAARAPLGDGRGNVTVGANKGKPEAKEPDPTGHKTISMEDDLPKEE
jgi:hypothetical protein